MKKVQRTWGNGDEKRYFWDVKATVGDSEIYQFNNYRSRCSTAAKVRAQFKKMGYAVKSVSQQKRKA